MDLVEAKSGRVGEPRSAEGQSSAFDSGGSLTSRAANGKQPGAATRSRCYRFAGGFVGSTPLRPYQAVGVSRMIASEQFALRDDAGLGKTIQAVYAAAALMKAGRIDRTLVVIQSNLRDDWREAFREHLPSARVQILAGVDKGKRAWDGAAEFAVVSYELLARSAMTRGQPVSGSDLAGAVRWMQGSRVLVILDDSHCIAKPTSKTFAATCVLRRFTARRFLLNADLLVELVEDAWAQFFFLDGGATFGASFPAFLARYCVQRRFDLRPGVSFWKTISNVNMGEFSAKLRANSLRRTRASHAYGIPREAVVPLRVIPSGVEASALRARMQGLYDALLLRQRAGQEQVTIGAGRRRMTEEEKRDDPGWMAAQMIQDSAIAYNGCAKMETLLRRLAEFRTQALVWVHHRAVGVSVDAALREAGVDCALATGAVSQEECSRALASFFVGHTRVIVGSYARLCVGRNTLKRCPYVFHWQPTWRLFHWKQSMGRVLRIGGSSGVEGGAYAGMVVIDRPMLRYTLDEYQWGHVDDKQRTAAAAEGGAGPESLQVSTARLVEYVRRQLVG